MKSPSSFGTSGLDAMAFSKMTWSGLMVVAFGWMLLLSGGSVQILLSPSAPSVSVIAQCTIASGFGLALLGALQTGFSALTRFFDSVLQRTAPRADAAHLYEAPPAARSDMSSLARPAAVRAVATRTEPVIAPPPPQRAAPVRMAAVKQPVKAAATKTPPRKVLERGWWKDRAYTIFLDGSVEIETLLGLRRFSCMADAQDFIG